MNPAISVIIPHMNRWPTLRATLSALTRQTRLDFEVIVANVGQCPKLDSSGFPYELRILAAGDQWNVGRARNLGAMAARARKLLFLDCDLSADASTIDRALAVTRRGTVWFPIVRNSHLTYNANAHRWRVWGYGVCGIMKSDLSKLMGWDELDGWGGEDTLLHWKAAHLGFTIVRERSGLVHRDHKHQTPWHRKRSGHEVRMHEAQTRWLLSIATRGQPTLPIYRIWPGHVRSQRAWNSWAGQIITDVPATMAADPTSTDSCHRACSKRQENQLRVMQFHPNMSYEDFVRGWRPSGDGALGLVDGPLMEMVKSALGKPTEPHVMVIEEINRGNPAQIFGEVLTLIEADKRTPDEAIELCHRRFDGERVYIPDNVYFIGTMNIADRSLALVDFALRRRFAFVDLKPELGAKWRHWVSSRCKVDLPLLDLIESRLSALNRQICEDPALGRAFQVGHSFVTPPLGIQISDFRGWFAQVVATEIGPLLDEYWFDAAEKAQEARKMLTQDL